NGAVPGPTLAIGDGIGTDTVRLDADNQISDSASLIIGVGARLDLNGHSDTVNTVGFVGGGTIITGSGTLTIDTQVIHGIDSTAASTISGNISLNAGITTFTILDGTSTPDLIVNAVIGNGQLWKEGP